MHAHRVAGILSAAAIALGACDSGDSPSSEAPSPGVPTSVRQSELQPGAPPLRASAKQAEPPVAQREIKNPYAGDMRAVAEGQRLYMWFNCVGCHAMGGGGMGPPLIDDTWIYGSAPANIFQSIAQGRPEGMPSFGGHIPDNEIWKLVAFVRALAGLDSKPSAGALSDPVQEKAPANLETAPERLKKDLKKEAHTPKPAHEDITERLSK